MLEIQNVSKRFPGVRALHDVSFTVDRGEVHALIGENGAGKSTLMKLLSGVYPDHEGQLLLDGQPLVLASPSDAQHRGIATIHQELNLIPELTIAENIFLAREPRTAAGLLDVVGWSESQRHSSTASTCTSPRTARSSGCAWASNSSSKSPKRSRSTPNFSSWTSRRPR